MARKTAGASGSSWDLEGELNGVYVEMKTNVGAHRSNLYVIEQPDGEKVQLWGSAVIDTKFAEIPLESEVWVKFLGNATSKSGTSYKDFSVEYDDALPLAEQADASKEDTDLEEAKNTFN